MSAMGSRATGDTDWISEMQSVRAAFVSGDRTSEIQEFGAMSAAIYYLSECVWIVGGKIKTRVKEEEQTMT
jgi:hypothetical protein